MSPRVLIVEDDDKIAALLRDYFVDDGFGVDTLADGSLVERAVLRDKPDLVVLDLQLPGKDGLEVCRDLRARGTEPAILMLTARVDEIDRLLGLRLGADDYVCKPFSAKEVVLRAHAILRRLRPGANDPGRLGVGPLEVDRQAHLAYCAGHEVRLTPIEFGLLEALLSGPHQIWTRAQLLQRVSGADFVGYERNIDSHVKNLRRKLKDRLSGADPLRSVWGKGYGLNLALLLGRGQACTVGGPTTARGEEKPMTRGGRLCARLGATSL
jgi:two-component system response regulator BaeR